MKETDRYMYAAFPSHKVPVQRMSDTCRSLAPAGKLIHGVLSCNICHILNLQIMTLIHRLPTRHWGTIMQSHWKYDER